MEVENCSGKDVSTVFTKIDEREVDHQDLESKERSREANRAVGEV